jgi:hypothetical protein
MKFPHIIKAEYLDGYRIWVRFHDGTEGEVDLVNEIDGTVFAPLKDIDFFKEFTLEGDTLTWPNGADFAPDFIHSYLRQIQTA